jgi:hypothetical protein
MSRDLLDVGRHWFDHGVDESGRIALYWWPCAGRPHTSPLGFERFLVGRPTVAQTPAMAAMPDVLEAGPLTLVRWRPKDLDEAVEAVRSSFAELQ